MDFKNDSIDDIFKQAYKKNGDMAGKIDVTDPTFIASKQFVKELEQAFEVWFEALTKAATKAEGAGMQEFMVKALTMYVVKGFYTAFKSNMGLENILLEKFEEMYKKEKGINPFTPKPDEPDMFNQK